MSCFLAHLGDCEHRADGCLDRAHLIPAQRLRIAHVDGEAIWDERAWVWMCRKHHHKMDNGFIKLRYEELPPGLLDYADEHGLWWSIQRDYPEMAI